MVATDDHTAAALFERLRKICELRFEARSCHQSGWNGKGRGDVAVAGSGTEILTFSESGVWLPVGGKETRFTNVFRWTILEPARIRLEHLRFGPSHPVCLFDLEPSVADEWRSVNPHQCREDCYTAILRVMEESLFLQWSILGPHKNETIEYHYQ